MNSSSLPNGLNSTIYEFCLNNQENLPDALEGKPDYFFDFALQALTGNRTWRESNPEWANRLITTLETFAKENKFSTEKVEQIKSVAYALLKKLPSASLQEMITAVEVSKLLHLGFYKKLKSVEVDDDNLSILFAISSKINDAYLLKKCLVYIGEKTGCVISSDKNRILWMKFDKVVAQEPLKKILAQLPKGNIRIQLTQNADQETDSLKEFVAAFGEHIVSLNLNAPKKPLSNEEIATLALNLPHLRKLHINCLKLNTEGLKSLTTLKTLESLSLNYSRLGIPTEISNLSNLQFFEFNYAIGSVKELPEAIFNLQSLQKITCKNCLFLSKLTQLKILFNNIHLDPSPKSIRTFKEQEALFTNAVYFMLELPKDEQKALLNNLNRVVNTQSFNETLYLHYILPKAQKELLSTLLTNKTPVKKIVDNPEIKQALTKLLNAPSLNQLWVAVELDLELPEEIAIAETLASVFDFEVKKNLTNAVKNIKIINYLFNHEKIGALLKAYFSTPDGKTILTHFSSFPEYCQSIHTFIEEKYPPHLSENAFLYPLKIHLDTGEISCAPNYPVLEPQRCLREISNSIAGHNQNLSVLTFSYISQKAVDHGAIKRDFFHKLLKTLSLEKEMQKGIPAKELKYEELEDYKRIGVVWNLLLKSKEKIPLGELFHPDFFKMLIEFYFFEIKQDFNDLSTERLCSLALAFPLEKDSTQELYAAQLKEFLELKPSTITSETIEKHQPFLKMVDIILGNNEPTVLNQNTLKELQESLRKDYSEKFKLKIQTIHAIATGFDYGLFASTESYWKQLQKAGPKKIQEIIQGSFNREDLLPSFLFGNTVNEEVRQMINQWVETKSDEELKGFLQYVYGSPVVPNKGIKINLFETLSIPQVVACYAEIRLPVRFNEEGESISSYKDALFKTLDSFSYAGTESFTME